ncbi:MAG: hypothetical protein WCY88_09375 [Spongiibacteraceae bacterium]
MKCLSFCVELARAEQFDKDSLLKHIKSLGRYPEVDIEGGVVAFNFFTEQLPELWQQLQAGLLANDRFGAMLTAASIVVAEGDEEGEDLLLFHYDPNEVRDQLG